MLGILLVYYTANTGAAECGVVVVLTERARGSGRLEKEKGVIRTRFCEPSWTGCVETSSWILWAMVSGYPSSLRFWGLVREGAAWETYWPLRRFARLSCV